MSHTREWYHVPFAFRKWVSRGFCPCRVDELISKSGCAWFSGVTYLSPVANCDTAELSFMGVPGG